MPGRLNLVQVMTLVIALAVGLAAMKVAAGWLARGIILSSVAGLLFATLAAIVRRRHRARWIGFALFGWGYALIVAGGPYLTDQYGDEKDFDIWQVDGAIRPLAARLHPERPKPVDPFPRDTIELDPATGLRTKERNGLVSPLAADEVKIQVAYETLSELYESRAREGRHARAIGLAIQGIAFALIGGAAGNALSDQSNRAGGSPEPPTSTQPG